MTRLNLSVLIATALAIATASTASAGSFEVVACDAAPGGANNSWITSTTSGRVAAYTQCPAGIGDSRGIVTRNSVEANGNAGAGQAARATFYAPPGTSISGIRASYLFFREGGEWIAGLSTGVQALDGCYAGTGRCERREADRFVPVPNTPQIYIETYCYGGFCPMASSGDPDRNYAKATARMSSARVTVQDDQLPTISELGGPLLSGGWKRGVQTVSFNANDNVGIQRTTVTLGRGITSRGKDCDYSRTVPCPQGGADVSVDTSLSVGDGPATAVVDVWDAAGNKQTLERPVRVDNTAPASPQALAVSGGEGWRSINEFKVGWQNPDESATAPIAGALYELCPVGGGPCVNGERSAPDLASLTVTTPTPGDYLLRVWLRDEAGNADRKLAAAAVHLRLDDSAPTLVFEKQDIADPTRVAVSARDEISGVAAGVIEGKRSSEAGWRPLRTGVKDGQLIAHLEDEQLPDGAYELRARASDQAGNERSTDRLADGKPALVTLPLRLKTRLTVGTRKGSGKHRRFVKRSRLSVPFGSRKRLTGRLTTVDRSPFPDAVITVYEQRPISGAAPTPLATLKTSRTGAFSFLARRGTSRTLSFRYEGTATIRSATKQVALNVAAASTMHSSRRLVVNGETVHFSGGLRGGVILPAGKLVELQVLVRRRWRTFATTRANASGRWSNDYRFDGTRGRQRYRFRARVPVETGYPYATGHSRRIVVTVRGL